MFSGRTEIGINTLCSGPETKELLTYTNLCGTSATGFIQPETANSQYNSFPIK